MDDYERLAWGIILLAVTIVTVIGIVVWHYNSTKFFVENNYCYETLKGQGDAAVWVKCDVKPKPKQGE